MLALGAAPTSGTVPLNVSFNSAGSSDPDGSIVAFEWTFGDGSAPVATAATSHVYAAAGTYTAQLKATDNSGLTTVRSVTITAQPPVAQLAVRVADIAMSLTLSGGRNARASAAVTVRDTAGNAVPGATVAGRWSGVVSGSSSALTGSSGIAAFSSPSTKSGGSFVFTVTSVTIAGYTYQATLNTETTDSITR